MKKLGLDIGKARIGIATCDPMCIVTSEVENYNCKSEIEDYKHISKIAEDLRVDEIVVGLPLNMDGTEGIMAEYVRNFCKNLQEYLPQCKITLWDERLSSYEAENILKASKGYSSWKKRKQILDALSASLILQSYIDKK